MTKAERRHIVLVSGGKDSTALALWLRDHRPDLGACAAEAQWM